MTKPNLEIKVQPSLNDNKAYYLPLAPKAAGANERFKIAFRLRITNKDTTRRAVKIVGITYSFPDTSLGIRTFAREPQYIDPEGGVLGLNDTATWSNGLVYLEDEEPWRNDVYLDAPAPPKVKVSVFCEDFTEPDFVIMDLIPWVDPTGDGPVRMPFSINNLDDDEYLVTSAIHKYNGGAGGAQLYAHDITVQSQKTGTWTTLKPNTNGDELTHYRIFGMPVRAIADGEVFLVDKGWIDNPVGADRPAGTPVGGNTVWVRHNTLEVKYSHFRSGSIIVSKDQRVTAGQRLGEAGNSGNTKKPHLHIAGRDTGTSTLRGFVFKNAWMLERSQVPAVGDGPRVLLRGKGISQETAAIRPSVMLRGPVGSVTAHDLVETIVAEVFGGTSQGGDGFVIVGGKFVRIPPRGPKWDLLQSLIALDAAEETDPQQRASMMRKISEAIAKISKEVGKQQ